MNALHHHAKRYSLNMLEGSLLDKIVLFALPFAVSSILQQLFNAADLAVVGRFASSEAMAAVGSNSSVINLIISLFVGLSVGVNTVIAGQIGGGHKMGAPENVMNLATVYPRIYFLAMPAILVYNYGSAILRSKGDSRRPLYALTLSGIINVILNLIFVIVFKLHVIGVGAATVISNMFGAGLILYYLMTEDDPFRLSFNKLCINRHFLRLMMQIGMPAGLQGMVFGLSNVVIQSSVNSFGANAIAGSTAAVNFDFLSYCVVNAFGQSAVTFMSQNYNAHKFDRCDKVALICMLSGAGTSAFVVFLLVTFRYSLIHIFTTDPQVIEYAMVRIMVSFSLHFLIASYEISGGCLRGMGHSLLPAMIAIFGTCIFRLIYVFTYVSKVHTFEALFRVYPISWVITGTLTLTAFFTMRKRLYKSAEQL